VTYRPSTRGLRAGKVYARDVFIGHASEDKASYARPLFDALNRLGVSVWLDESEVQDGESLSTSVGRGLRGASLVVLLVTPNFIGKFWPETELANALSMEISSGKVRIVPILDVSHAIFADRYPLMADKLSRSWDTGVSELASILAERIDHRVDDWHWGIHPQEYTGPVWVRIAAAPGQEGHDHVVTILWGDSLFEKTIHVGDTPLSLRHRKMLNDHAPLLIHTSPAAQVTVGEGPAPDKHNLLIDEGWRRIEGSPQTRL
jgi:hypothetical protein